MKASEIINTYYKGEHTVGEVNKVLEEHGYNLRMVNGLKELTDKEKEITNANMAKGILTGWALVDVQVGGLEKIKVTDGKLADNIGFNTICYMGDTKFRVVDGEKLVPAE